MVQNIQKDRFPAINSLEKACAVIKIQNLQFTYPHAQTPVLDQLEFNIDKGEIFGLLGPSGSGKSTTQKILMGLLPGFSGTAEVFGRPIQNISNDFYQRIGVCFELPALYLRLTAKENLEMFAALYAGPTRNPMEVLCLVGLDRAADQRVETFSKGMKMRLNLCRALLHDPELLFLDEPTTGQDPARARLTHKLILRLKEEGKTIFLTTHNMAEADEICDRVGFLSKGKIPIIGTPENLKRQFGKHEIQVKYKSPTAQQKGLQSITFPVCDIGANKRFLKTLADNDIVSIHTLEASLDEVFIQATGSPEHI